jgi:hypothetical protein
LRTRGVRRAYFGPGQPLEAERYVQNVGGARTFVTNRPLDKGFFAICDKETASFVLDGSIPGLRA